MLKMQEKKKGFAEMPLCATPLVFINATLTLHSNYALVQCSFKK